MTEISNITTCAWSSLIRTDRNIEVVKNDTTLLSLTGRGTSKSFSNIYHVDYDSFDAIAFALDLSQELRHLVTVEGIHNIAVDVVTHLQE